jgi:hypothetical protein
MMDKHSADGEPSPLRWTVVPGRVRGFVATAVALSADLSRRPPTAQDPDVHPVIAGRRDGGEVPAILLPL